MAKHVLHIEKETREPTIGWFLDIEDDRLRIKAVGYRGEEKIVFSVYRSGYFHRHHDVEITGLVLNSNGQIREIDREE